MFVYISVTLGDVHSLSTFYLSSKVLFWSFSELCFKSKCISCTCIACNVDISHFPPHNIVIEGAKCVKVLNELALMSRCKAQVHLSELGSEVHKRGNRKKIEHHKSYYLACTHNTKLHKLMINGC